MSTKNNMLTDISAELDREFGTPGSPEREKFDEESYAFYTGQILHDYTVVNIRPMCIIHIFFS